MRKISIILLVSVLFFGCAPSVQYIGKSYTPTEQVDVFMDTDEIKKGYEVIGKIDGVSGVFGSGFDEIQEKIVQSARAKGADGVILYNMEQRIIGTTSSSNTNWKSGTAAHRQWYDQVLSTNKGSSSTVSSSSNITQNVLHADFIKYIK